MVYPSADNSGPHEHSEDGISIQNDQSQVPGSGKQKTKRNAKLRSPYRETQYLDIDEALAARVEANVSDFETLATEANEANERERNMKLLDAFKTNRKAIGWSALASLCIVMTAYGTAVIGTYNAYPAFLHKFGVKTPSGFAVISEPWQKGLSAAANLGQIIGLQVGSFMSDRLGYRWTIMSLLIAATSFAFIPIFAESLPVFLVGYLLQSITWGAFQPVTVAYSAEACPVRLRHYIVVFVYLCWIVGQLISTGIIIAFQQRQGDEWGYRAPFALQLIWPIPIAFGIYLAPESPWWCVRKGYTDRARVSVKRLTRSISQHEVNATIALMVYVDETEKRLSKGTTYPDCFRGINLRRTEIVCILWLAYAMSGAVLGGLRDTLLSQGGISEQILLILLWVVSSLNLVITIITWLLMGRIGRKTLLLSCMSVILAVLLIIGFMGIPKKLSDTEAIVAGTLVIILLIAGDPIAPVVYTIVAEIPSTRLRIKSIVLARSVYIIANASFVTIVVPRQLSLDQWNWGLKSGLFWAGVNAVFTTYIYFRLPETKGRTYADLNVLFEDKVSARKFDSTKVRPLQEGIENSQWVQIIRLANTAALEHQTRDVVVGTSAQ
ncbi:hypothetical protein HD806DRAFT_485956 [Xylariaceae sp. AK1471]|nr:hypothetical protein HD806DRAFT_485956 [Xylariaceae sp. AK1471]